MPKIIVFGSLNADMVFSVPTLPRPGETILCPSYAVFPGGKGANQAVAAARAGARARMVGRIGRDGFGEILMASLNATGVDTSGVENVDTPTGCAAIVVNDSGENQIAAAAGANLKASADQIRDTELSTLVTVLLQMEVDPEQCWVLAERARNAGARVLLNAAPAGPVPDSVLRMVDFLIVNEIEAVTVAEAVGLSPGDQSDAARLLHDRFGTAVVVTLGGKGAFAVLDDGEWTIESLPIKPVDTTAAGDAFVGNFAFAVGSGMPLQDALRWASVAGGLACLREGAQPSLPTAVEIESRLAELPVARGFSRLENDVVHERDRP